MWHKVYIYGVGSLVDLPPTILTFSSYEDSSNLKIDSPSHLVFPSLFWDMEDIYGTSQGLCQYLRAMGTIELDAFIQDFDTTLNMQQFWNPQLFILFLVWKSLFQHLEGPPMDGYHEFYQVHQINIED